MNQSEAEITIDAIEFVFERNRDGRPDIKARYQIKDRTVFTVKAIEGNLASVELSPYACPPYVSPDELPAGVYRNSNNELEIDLASPEIKYLNFWFY